MSCCTIARSYGALPVGAIALNEKNHRRAVNGYAADTYSSLDVSNMTGVSLRQLQWWDEQGVVSPVQRGHRRMYQLHEVVEVSLITELRRKEGGSKPKVVFCTTENDVAHIREAIEAGADEYVMKPFDHDTLQMKLQLIGAA